jgi:predicted methyltransferase MtxX (methanogen marker protein 4)
MLSKKQMDAFAAMTGITADVLAKAISDEQEVELELPEGRFFTKEKEETLLDNHGKRKYDEGISKATKDAYDGKSKDDFLKGIKSTLLEEAKVEPNKKVTELESSLEVLRNQILEKDTAFESLKGSVDGERKMLKAQSFIPELPESLGLKKSEAANLILNGVEIKEDGIYKNGELVKDSMQKALSLEDFIKESVNSRGWAKVPSGRGGGSGGAVGASSSKPKTIEEYEAVIKEKGLHIGSAEAQAILQEAAKETPEILG